MTEDELYRRGYADAYTYLELFNVGTMQFVAKMLTLGYTGRYYDGMRDAISLIQQTEQDRELTVAEIKAGIDRLDTMK